MVDRLVEQLGNVVVVQRVAHRLALALPLHQAQVLVAVRRAPRRRPARPVGTSVVGPDPRAAVGRLGARAVRGLGGRLVEVGSPASLGTASLGGARLGTGGAQTADQLERAGRTAVAVLVDGDPVGLLALADRVRPDAAATVAALRTLTGHTPVLLSGDNPGAADRLAAQVGITEVHAGLLPEDKVARVRALRAGGHRCCWWGTA